jgi:oxygen-independent coproporphyrinogen-3 oxidase
VAANGVGWAETEPLDPVDEAEERLMMGLRLIEGVALPPLEARRGRPFARTALDDLAAQGLIVFDGARVHVTAEGRLLTDRIAREVCLAP